MKLFKITTIFLGKDLEQRAILGFITRGTEDEVADYINEKYRYEEWFGEEDEGAEWLAEQKAKIIAAKGDLEAPYEGEFYDQKYGWEGLGEVTDEQIATLKALSVITD
jgi:hypothetical protein